MNYQIHWEKLTQQEAQTIIDIIAAGFNLVVKNFQDDKFYDVGYLEVRGIYDDNFHANENVYLKVKSLGVKTDATE